MLVVSKFRVIATLTVCVLGLLITIPSMLNQETYDKLPTPLQNGVNLGLELRGGSHLQLEVDLSSVKRERLENILDEVRKQLRKKGIRYNKLSVFEKDKRQTISISVKEGNDIEEVKKILKKVESELEIEADGISVTARITQKSSDEFSKRIVGESIEVIRHRIDETGTKEPTILRQGTDRIVLQLPGVEDPSEVKRLLGKTAILTFHGVDETLETIPAKVGQKINLPKKPGVMYLPEEKGDGVVYYVPIKKQISLTGKSLEDAQVSIDSRTGLPAVSIKFDKIDGTRKIAELSAKYLHKQFAMVLDGKVLSAPVFQAVLTDGNAQITGNFTMKEATELALLLRAGSLPAPLNVVEERNVGPSLGTDSINAGKNATMCAFLFVATFMIATYGIFGLFSVVAIFMNIVLLFACLTLLGATLTLPGIAGIALTIGTAVDANVLIYERIREEVRLGIRTAMAISQGYKMALSTIVDSNLTTLIGSIVLYEFGSGPIRGFAVTLALGIVISLFTTFSLTKSLIAMYVRKNKDKEIIV